MNSRDQRSCADLPPSELDLVLTCSHTKRCLLKAGINTLDQLLSLSCSDLLQIRGIGRVIARDIVAAQEQYTLQADTQSIAPPNKQRERNIKT